MFPQRLLCRIMSHQRDAVVVVIINTYMEGVHGAYTLDYQLTPDANLHKTSNYTDILKRS